MQTKKENQLFLHINNKNTNLHIINYLHNQKELQNKRNNINNEIKELLKNYKTKDPAQQINEEFTILFNNTHKLFKELKSLNETKKNNIDTLFTNCPELDEEVKTLFIDNDYYLSIDNKVNQIIYNGDFKPNYKEDFETIKNNIKHIGRLYTKLVAFGKNTKKRQKKVKKVKKKLKKTKKN